MSLKQYKM